MIKVKKNTPESNDGEEVKQGLEIKFNLGKSSNFKTKILRETLKKYRLLFIIGIILSTIFVSLEVRFLLFIKSITENSLAGNIEIVQNYIPISAIIIVFFNYIIFY